MKVGEIWKLKHEDTEFYYSTVRIYRLGPAISVDGNVNVVDGVHVREINDETKEDEEGIDQLPIDEFLENYEKVYE